MKNGWSPVSEWFHDWAGWHDRTLLSSGKTLNLYSITLSILLNPLAVKLPCQLSFDIENVVLIIIGINNSLCIFDYNVLFSLVVLCIKICDLKDGILWICFGVNCIAWGSWNYLSGRMLIWCTFYMAGLLVLVLGV